MMTKKMVTAGFLTLLFLPALPATAPAEGEIYGRLKSGKESFQAKCGLCHPLKDALNETKSRDDWEITVAMMKSNGAVLTDEESAVIVDYLSTKSLFETKCSVCHKIQRPLSKSKDMNGWKATVTRMSGKRPGHLTETEIEQIVAHLSLERPLQ